MSVLLFKPPPPLNSRLRQSRISHCSYRGIATSLSSYQISQAPANKSTKEIQRMLEQTLRYVVSVRAAGAKFRGTFKSCRLFVQARFMFLKLS